MGLFRGRRHPIKVQATFKVRQQGLSDTDLDTLAALCETKGFEHLVCPHGEPERAVSWRDLAQRCRDTKGEAA